MSWYDAHKSAVTLFYIISVKEELKNIFAKELLIPEN